ncbi:MAG: Ig-like domain repeat protein, partial [Propionibacteriaceae bacterium]|nr:Ig-like domain repeat protein [Propionibacteriaceae bacterium]
YKGFKDGRAYYLNVALTSTASELEDNSTVANATWVRSGQATVGSAYWSGTADTDYYGIKLTNPGALTLSLTYPNKGGTATAYTVEVTDGTTALFRYTLTQAQYDGATLRSKPQYLPAGNYYIAVKANKASNPLWGLTYTFTATATAMLAEKEPNDASTTATAISSGVPIAGSSNRITSPDQDWYIFSAAYTSPANFKLDFSVSGDPGDAAYDVDVYWLNPTTSSLVQIGSTYNLKLADAGQYRATAINLQQNGRFFIRVQAANTYKTWQAPYTLTAAFSQLYTTLEPDNADDGSYTNALPIAQGATVTGYLKGTGNDVDTYQVEVANPSRLYLSFTYPAMDASKDVYRLKVYSVESGTQVDRYYWVLRGDKADGSWLNNVYMYVPAGTYYIEISGLTTWPSGNQPYYLQVGTGAQNVEFEPNATSATATFIQLGEVLTGSLLNATKSGDQYVDDDWFAFQITETDIYTINLAHANLGVDANFAVMNLSGADTDTKVSKANEANSTIQRTLKPGKYFLKIEGNDSLPSWGQYYQLVVGKVMVAGTVAISGSAVVGSTLTAITSGWTPSNVTLYYQWYRNGVAIPGATGQTYTLTAADQGATITVGVTGGHNDYAPAAGAASAGVIAPAPYQAPAVSITAGKVTITGTPAIGKTLKANTGTWSPAGVSFNYQWYRNGKAISKAYGSTYKLVKADKYAKITVVVTGLYPNAYNVSAVSKATAKIKYASTTTAKLSKTSIKKSAKGKVSVTLKTSLTKKPTGKVTVTAKKGTSSKKVTYTFKAAKKGKATITLPKLAKGTWKVTVKYAGTTKIYKSTSKTLKLKVK